MKKVKDLVERVKMWVKFDKEQAIVAGVLVGSLTIFGLGWFVGDCGTVSKTMYDDTIEEKETLVKTNKGLVEDKQELQSKIDSAKDYFELDENEKVIVDQKIEEVNKATEEQKEAEKHQQELQVARDSVSEYINLIDSKSYYDMTPEERTKVTQFIDTKFNELPEELKSEYQAKYDSAKTSKDEGVAKLQAEEEAKKAAEEEAKRQAEEEQRKQLEYGNAIDCAQDYVDLMAFSRQRLISQLEYEGYSNEAAIYAVDNIRVDWNSECAECAQDYLNFMSFSRQGLYDQLAYEGFTDEQIQYGLSQVGY